MASQITHIVLAERISYKIFNKFDREQFSIGTVFPDIRYLKVIERNQTHFKDLNFNKDILKETDSFVAGMKYHSFVDLVREDYMIKNNIYELLPDFKYITQALKLYEDEILYSKVSDWGQKLDYLNRVLPEQEKLVPDNRNKIKEWHLLMQEYFKQPPTDETREKFILGVGFPKETADEINQIIDHMRKTPEIKKIILDMYENWGSL